MAKDGDVDFVGGVWVRHYRNAWSPIVETFDPVLPPTDYKLVGTLPAGESVEAIEPATDGGVDESATGDGQRRSTSSTASSSKRNRRRARRR